MSFQEHFRQEAVARPRQEDEYPELKWPLQKTFWLLLSLGSFTWIAIIFACLVWL